MSDYLKSLSARSFGLQEGPENVRPRLPSLFEQPQTSGSASNIQMFEESGETRDISVEEPVRNTSGFDSIESNLRSAENAQNRLKKSRSITFVETQPGVLDANLLANSAQDRLSNSLLSVPHVKNQVHFAGAAASPAIEEIDPSFKQPASRLNKDQSNSRQISDNKSVSPSIQQSPVITRSGPEPNFKRARLEEFSNKQVVKNDFPLQQEDKRSIAAQQPSSLVADISVLERLVMDKISLHTQVNPVVGESSVNIASKQTPISPQADASIFNSKWPSLKLTAQSQENRAESSGGESEPTIQVTIGRIEIRATPPASSSGIRKNPDKKPSTMSLEEYLNKRNRGVQQ